jgi:hypothetical protein
MLWEHMHVETVQTKFNSTQAVCQHPWTVSGCKLAADYGKSAFQFWCKSKRNYYSIRKNREFTEEIPILIPTPKKMVFSGNLDFCRNSAIKNMKMQDIIGTMLAPWCWWC